MYYLNKKMEFIEIKQNELKSITLFLIENKIILHPKISPNGFPNFTGYIGKRFIVILDRNLLIRILRLVKEGELKDKHSLKLVSSLLLWSEFNNISLSSGLALMEYSHFHGNNLESSTENNIFLEIYKQYTPKHWLDLATGRQSSIPKLELKKQEQFNFFVEDDHFKMHYLEMLKLSQLYFDDAIPIIEKFNLFHRWVYENILICKYTTYFAAILFGNNSKTFKKVESNFESVVKKCKNVAWDLTYLSFWSTQYYYESSAQDIYLFATMDKELRDLFFITHTESSEIYLQIFGNEVGTYITHNLNEIYLPREKPDIRQGNLDAMIGNEQEILKSILKRKLAI